MNLLSIFKRSLMLPKKEALFSLNRVSMRDAMVYIIILLFILFLPDIVHDFIRSSSSDNSFLLEVFVVRLLVLYPLLILFIMVSSISLLSALIIPIKELLKRKLKYQQLWKMTVFALTIPLIIIFAFRILQINEWYINLLPLIIYFVLMIKMITVYPKRKL